MKHETITVKVHERDTESRSQTAWQRSLNMFCERLVKSGYAMSAKVHVVFPDNPNPAMASIFTIDVEPTAQGLDEPLHNLQAMPGIQFAQLAPGRRPLLGTTSTV
jgi:hypothetical protein